MDGMTITKPQLQAALQKWEQRARDGNWPRTLDDSVEDVAKQGADLLWALLIDAPVPA